MRRIRFSSIPPVFLPALWIIFTAGLISGQAGGAQGSAPGTIQGLVKDSSGLSVAGAVVTLQTAASTLQRTAITDQSGSFRFSAVEPGNYAITIAAAGFALWTAPKIAVVSGGHPPLVLAVLQVAEASTSVDVTLPPHELAAAQLKTEEKQRVLGIFPDFFVSYARDAAPLTAAQKFQLGWRTMIDPVVFIDTGIVAGIQQGRNNYPEFGQGVQGYATRFGALYADRVTGIMIGHVLTQSIFHQDPRYFYKGTGTVRSRILYAIGTAFVRRGDNKHWQPDYTDVLGSIASGEISSLYYPATSRPVRRLADDVVLGFGGRAANHLLHEFVFSKVTTHGPKTAAGPVLREGTPVSLISVADWSSKMAESGGPVELMLASDIKVDGVIVAPVGSKALGLVSVASGPDEAGNALHIRLEHVRMKIGDTNVPLRSTPLKDGSGPLEYHRLENSGRVAIVLYVDENVTLPPAP